jgi:hypothetical protein
MMPITKENAEINVALSVAPTSIVDAAASLRLARSHCANLDVALRAAQRWSREDSRRRRGLQPVPDTMPYLLKGFELYYRVGNLLGEILTQVKNAIAACEAIVQRAAVEAAGEANGASQRGFRALQLIEEITAFGLRVQKCTGGMDEVAGVIEGLQARTVKFYPVGKDPAATALTVH